MSGKNMRNLGIVGSIIGAIILVIGLVKYNNANSMYRASSWFGENDTSRRWEGYMQNYKICIIVGTIIFIVFVILAIAGFINSLDKTSSCVVISDSGSNIPASDKMKELKIMIDNGLISQEEFVLKKKEIIDKM